MSVSALSPVAAPAEPGDLLDRRGDGTRRMFRRLTTLAPGTAEHRELRDQLVELHLPLVRYFARRYAGRSEPFEDIVQAGALGLVEAVNRFDPHRGLAFSTFAAPTILGEIRRHFRDHTWAVHVERALQERSLQVAATVRDISQETGRSPTAAEVAERTGLTLKQVVDSITCNAAYSAVSFDVPADGDHTLGDRLGDDDPAYDRVELRESLGRALAELPHRDQQILLLRFCENMTQAQIGAQLGISQMHVSRLLGRILARLRRQLVACD